MNFCTLFLKTENVHLMKDIGQLPFCLQEDYGYHAYIATYNNGEYSYLTNEVKGLELKFVKKSFLGQAFDGLRFLFKMHKKIDILNVYHLNLNSFLWILFFKMIRGKKAIVYLKLDADHLEIGKMQHKNLKAWVKKITINSADIVSAESSVMQEALQKYCKEKILHIPNGYLDFEKTEEEIRKKENIVLTVGRLGTYQKATEVLVDAFLQSDIAADWKLVLVGPMTEEFETWIENRVREYPDAQNRIFAPGNIENKEILQEWYRRSKVFALPSRYEGFPIVLIEALTKGCYIITSDVVLAAKDLIQDKRMGCTVKTDSREELAETLAMVSRVEMDWDNNARRIERSMEDRFLWKNILLPLDDRFRNCMEEYTCRTQK